MKDSSERSFYEEKDLEIKNQVELEEAKKMAGVTTHEEVIKRLAEYDRKKESEESDEDKQEEILVEKIKEQVYKDLESLGRGASIAKIESLQSLLKKNAPGFRLEIFEANAPYNDPKKDLWLLAALISPDGKKIYVIPALDSIIGASDKMLQWFDGGEYYDGTQALSYSDEVKKVAIGTWNSELKRWEPKEKGVIRTRYEQGLEKGFEK